MTAITLEHAGPWTEEEYLALPAKDPVLKPHLYAEAGIPWYLRVEPRTPDPPELSLGHLAGGVYAEHARAGAGEELALPAPFGVALDPATLLRRRR